MAVAAPVFSLVEFLKEVSGPILGFIVSGIGLAVYDKIKKRAGLPATNGKQLAGIKDQLEGFILKYDEGVSRSKDFQLTLFNIQSYMMKSLMKQTGAIREISKTVCNGNTKEATDLCDDADSFCKEGIELRDKLLTDTLQEAL